MEGPFTVDNPLPACGNAGHFQCALNGFGTAVAEKGPPQLARCNLGNIMGQCGSHTVEAGLQQIRQLLGLFQSPLGRRRVMPQVQCSICSQEV